MHCGTEARNGYAFTDKVFSNLEHGVLFEGDPKQFLKEMQAAHACSITKEAQKMKDSELNFDRSCHVLYSKPCKKQILEKIALHYPPEKREEIWTGVQLKYIDFISDWRTDLGGSKIFITERAGTMTASPLWRITSYAGRLQAFPKLRKWKGTFFLPRSEK